MPVYGQGRWCTNHPYKDSALSINNAKNPIWSRLFIISVVRLQESFPPATLSCCLGDRVVERAAPSQSDKLGLGFTNGFLFLLQVGVCTIYVLPLFTFKLRSICLDFSHPHPLFQHRMSCSRRLDRTL